MLFCMHEMTEHKRKIFFVTNQIYREKEAKALFHFLTSIFHVIFVFGDWNQVTSVQEVLRVFS